MCTRSFRQYIRNHVQSQNPNLRFDYIHAGGDAALLRSDELPEDDPDLGLQKIQITFTNFSDL